MDVHKNARLTPLGRERIMAQVAGGQTDCNRVPAPITVFPKRDLSVRFYPIGRISAAQFLSVRINPKIVFGFSNLSRILAMRCGFNAHCNGLTTIFRGKHVNR